MSGDTLLVNFANHHPADVADRMDNYAAADIVELLEAFPPAVACPVLSRLASRPLASVLKIISPRQLGAMLALGHYSDVIALVSHMNGSCQQQVLAAAPEDVQEQLGRLFHTSLKTLSGIASPEFVRVELDNNCGAVREQLFSSEIDDEQPIFVINEFGEYQGIVSPMVLLQQKNADRRIAEVLQRVEALSGNTPFAAAVGAPQWTRFRALPVVDGQSRLLGALTLEQLVRASNGLTETDSGFGELVGEVAASYIDICANLMEITMGRNTIEPK
ncbi:hypothetical protein [Oceanicoccus sp. KOV_DT_Chl]|uniref:hypothetical protein n=1 Tax=Oceanicoccus sp. KOV_DT_Chl TaxID=1904639 RepID=UPI000C7DDB24|nr:hypothetical protein [Oceanicoccus sp. KOV_DT_Chl]